MTEAASRAPQEASRRSTTLHRARCAWLENILMSRDQHHAHLGAALASTQLPRGNQPSSPAPASPAPSTSTLRPAAPLLTTAPARPASSAPRAARASPAPPAPTRPTQAPPPPARRARFRGSGRRRAACRPTTACESPRCAQKCRWTISTKYALRTVRHRGHGTI